MDKSGAPLRNKNAEVKESGMPPHCQHLFLTTLILSLLIGCSKQDAATPYERDGFSVVPAEHWEFSKDSTDSFFGEREIVFSLGEFSFAAFYIRDSSTNFADFYTFYLQKTQHGISHPKTKIEKSDSTVAGFDAVTVTMPSLLMEQEENATLYAVNIPSGDKTVYFMALIAPEDNVAIESDLEAVIESLNFKG